MIVRYVFLTLISYFLSHLISEKSSVYTNHNFRSANQALTVQYLTLMYILILTVQL